ncbi:hypothetical protein TK43_12990 [Roseovarius sp. JS7-11]|nr:hypothetical protein TK43_12990 [Roseovarius sp. JS7-11]
MKIGHLCLQFHDPGHLAGIGRGGGRGRGCRAFHTGPFARIDTLVDLHARGVDQIGDTAAGHHIDILGQNAERARPLSQRATRDHEPLGPACDLTIIDSRATACRNGSGRRSGLFNRWTGQGGAGQQRQGEGVRQSGHIGSDLRKCEF